MLDWKPINTPTATKLQPPKSSSPFSDPTLCWGLVGSLQHLTFTRPDLSYAVNFVFQQMQNLTDFHFMLVKRILWYVKGTIHFGNVITAKTDLNLIGFSDADWAGCPTTRRSTTGYCTFVGNNCISWSAKKQTIVSRSSTEAEYSAMVVTVAQVTWLSNLLKDLFISQASPPILFSDNLSALQLTVNPVFHARTKHVEIDYHRVREQVALHRLETRFVA